MPYIGNQPGTGVRSRFIYTATASQTTFTGADDNSKTLKYADSAYVDVFLNGVCLVPGTDYTASTKTSIVLTQAASLNDTLEVVAYDIASMDDSISAADGGTFQSDVTFADGADIITASKGTDNVRLGEGAGDSIASGGDRNITIGKNAGTAITTGSRNVGIGHQSLLVNTVGSRSVAVGHNSLSTQNPASATNMYNTAVGHEAGAAITIGTENTIVGALAGDAVTDGNGNVIMGYEAGTSATTTDHSVLIGYQAAGSGTMTGHDNTFIGMRAGKDCTSGQRNVAVGRETMNAITTGEGNIAIGNDSLYRLTTGDNNIAIGVDSLAYEDDQGRNVAIGWSTLKNLNVPSADGENTAVGYNAGRNLTTALQNTFIGSYAGSNASTTDHSVCVGYYAGGNGVMTGHDNVCVGAYAGYNVTAGRNVLVGRFAGASNIYLTTGVANVIIGDNARVNSSAMSNAIVMGELVTGTGNNAFTFGNGATDSNIDFGATSITAPSDERYKEEIATSTAGLSFVNDLRPVTFKWKKAKDVPSDHEAYIADGEEGCDNRVMLSNGETNHGFIAQEVKTAIDNHPEIKDGFRMWSEDYREDEDGNAIANGRQRVAPAELIPILTKAIQELSAKNDALETRIAALEAE